MNKTVRQIKEALKPKLSHVDLYKGRASKETLDAVREMIGKGITRTQAAKNHKVSTTAITNVYNSLKDIASREHQRATVNRGMPEGAPKREKRDGALITLAEAKALYAAVSPHGSYDSRRFKGVVFVMCEGDSYLDACLKVSLQEPEIKKAVAQMDDELRRENERAARLMKEFE